MEKIKALIIDCNHELAQLYLKLENDSYLFKEMENVFKEGVRYYIRQKYEKAIESFDIVLKDVQYNKEALLYKKRSQDIILKNKNSAEANELLLKAQELYNNGNIPISFTNIKQARDLNSYNTNILNLFLKCNEIISYKRKSGRIQ